MSHDRDPDHIPIYQSSTMQLADPSLDFQLASRLTRILAWEVDGASGEMSWSGDTALIFPAPAPDTYDGLVDLMHPDDRIRVRDIAERWLHDGGEFDVEFRLLGPSNDHAIWVRCHGTRLRDDATGQERHIGVAQDITAYKQREQDTALLTETQLILESTASTQTALATIAGKVVDHMGLSRFAIGYISPEIESSTLVHEHRRNNHPAPPFSKITEISSFLSPEVQDALIHGQPVAISDVHDDTRHAEHLDRYERHKERAELMIPFRTRGQWAILLSVFRDTPHTWEQHEIDLLTEIMERVSPRLEQSRVSRDFQESEDRYHALVNSMDEGFCIIELMFDDAGKPVDYRFLEVNAAFERHTSLHDAAGRRMRELVPDHEERWFEIYGEVALTGKPIRFTQTAQGLEGRWFSLYAFRVGDPTEHKVAVIFHDITAERRAEEAIRESASRLRKIMEIETIGIVMFRQDRMITDANDAFLRMCGYAREDLENNGLTIATITPSEWKPDSLHATDDLFVHEHMDPYEREFLRKDGTRVWGLVAGSRISENEAVKFVVDITDTKHIEQEQERLAAIVASSFDAIIRCEPDGTIVDVNRAAILLYRLTREDFLGRNITDFAPADKKDEFADRFARLACGEEVPPWETIRTRDDGSTMQLEIRMSPIRDATGRLVGCSGMLRDIGERKRLEQAQDDFLAMASHDLRSPITVLLGRAQLIRRRKKFDESGIETIITQARRIERLTADLQQVIHMESGKFELDRADVDLTAIAHAAIDRIRPETTEITFSLDTPDEPVVGKWDQHRLGQVMDNLLVNSVKYSPGGGDVNIAIRSDGEIAELRISDQGSGIPEEDQKRLFSRFYRSQESRQVAGLGLGLYITRMLLEAHGGTIGVNSEVGKGTTFTIHLPCTTESG